jgi:hypothetical protein
MFDQLFTRQASIAHHKSSPFTAERQLYLVDVLKAKVAHLAAAHSVHGDDQQHRVIPDLARRVACTGCKQSLHVAPLREPEGGERAAAFEEAQHWRRLYGVHLAIAYGLDEGAEADGFATAQGQSLSHLLIRIERCFGFRGGTWPRQPRLRIYWLNE